MITQISFTADAGLKSQALQKAKREGISLKTLLIYAMKGFVDGNISLGIKSSEAETEVEEVNFSDRSINEKALKLAQLLK